MKGKESDHRTGLRWNPEDQRVHHKKNATLRPEDRDDDFDLSDFADLDELIQETSLDLPQMDAERMNRTVMDRIYEESPWVLPGESKTFASQHWFRSRAAIWIGSLLAVFVVSFIYLVGFGIPERETNIAQDVPAGVISQPLTVQAGGAETVDFVADKQTPGRGIIEPLVAQIGPTHPQYWMFLSLTGMGLALLSLTRIAAKRK
ncbi:hypothetical protein [Saccharibacillus sp. JS10]|uniref:hypothetical protein n=1 Tax=Saccharibacillus sp. JS10 TaxID=2950552 RepID=UPI00210E91EA|nr:hypothetical protein [Saccharibacillus sp. JS10]MCQ4085781.1 hypothetical protein [Saccharibacillus sp. JS10]